MAKLNAAGSALLYSTYLGGSNNDNGVGIAVDSAGNAYVTGDTDSPDFPLVNQLQDYNPGFHLLFVSALNQTGSSLLYSTYFGGPSDNTGTGIAVDGTGAAYVTGSTDALDFPTMNPLQPTLRGHTNAFVARLALKPRVMAPDTSPAGQDIPVHGADLAANGPYSVYADSPGYPDQSFDGTASPTGTFEQAFQTTDAPPGTMFRIWAVDNTSGALSDYVFVTLQ